VKHNDIVSVKRFGSLKYQARVNWVEDNKVGVTFLTPEEVKGGCSIVEEKECTLISASAKDEMVERIASISEEELEERILSIRRRRVPKCPTKRNKKSTVVKEVKERKASLDDLFKKMEENPKIERK